MVHRRNESSAECGLMLSNRLRDLEVGCEGCRLSQRRVTSCPPPPSAGCFIRQPAYRCQSQVNRGRGVRVLFECDSVPCDHGPVEASLGSEQYQSMNSRMAWSYKRFELEDMRLFKPQISIVLDRVICGPFSGLVCVCSSPLEAASTAAAKSMILFPIF